MTLSLERSITAEPSIAPSRRGVRSTPAAPDHVFLPGWPLVLSLVGLPVWWVLGLSQLIYFAVAVPMVVHLLKVRAVRVPRGFSIWLLFLGWVLAGTAVLYVNAPGTLTGGGGFGRLLTFGYRFGWYAVATVAMLYVVNTRTVLSTSRIAGALSVVFLTLVGGGYLGLLVPRLEFASALELVLPGQLTRNTFVRDLVHAQAAQIQTFLGGEDARPSAPFTYTNLWGLNIALTLPFFVAEWWKRGGRWRTSVPPLLVVAAVPVIFSLNRGLWGAVLVMLVFFAVRTAIAGRVAVLAGIGLVGVLAVGAIALSPAGDLIAQRLDNPHSNEGRGNLGLLAVESTLEGSPLIGFGSTREVAGNFNTITGGESEACPRCSPPPLGTQGQLWLLVFGSGVGGLVLYLAFFGGTFARHVRSRSPDAMAATSSLLVLFVTMPVYNSVGFGIFIAAIAVGLLGREDDPDTHPPLDDLVRRLVRHARTIGVCTALGGLAGITLQLAVGSDASATQSVLVPPADLTGTPTSRPLTLDDEAFIATSQPVLRAVDSAVATDSFDHVRDTLSMSAEANSRILKFTYVHPDPAVASRAVGVAAEEYLAQRAELIDEAADALRLRLDDRLRSLDDDYDASLADDDPVVLSDALATLQVRAEGGTARLAPGDDVDDAGRTLALPAIVQSTDDWFVRVSSGLALGALVGLVLVRLVDRRWNRLGNRPERQLAPFDLPTIVEVAPEAARSLSAIALARAARATRSYLPVAGILADPESPTSIALARELDRTVGDVDQRRGHRVVVVAESSSRVESVMALLRSCESSGNEPVGIVFIG